MESWRPLIPCFGMPVLRFSASPTEGVVLHCSGGRLLRMQGGLGIDPSLNVYSFDNPAVRKARQAWRHIADQEHRLGETSLRTIHHMPRLARAIVKAERRAAHQRRSA
jgi:hypothetical protein